MNSVFVVLDWWIGEFLEKLCLAVFSFHVSFLYSSHRLGLPTLLAMCVAKVWVKQSVGAVEVYSNGC